MSKPFHEIIQEQGIDLATYQKSAIDTALPTAHSSKYLLPGLISEIGELAGVLAKEHRDSTGINEHDRICELGDIAWVTAVWLHFLGIHDDSNQQLGVPDDELTVNWPTDPMDVIIMMSTAVEGLTYHCYMSYPPAGKADASKDMFFDDKRGRDLAVFALISIWRILKLYSHVIAPGVTNAFNLALWTNLDKLQSRKLRGKLGGSGDHR